MAAASYLLALDQGTTSTRAILFDREGRPEASAQEPVAARYPAPGWVEQDPEAIWAGVVRVLGAVVAEAAAKGIARSAIAALGITNQRETTVVWERASGRPIAPAIVWQDRRTAEHCEALRRAGHEGPVRARTGLLFDPYFSATKLAWILDTVPGGRAAAEAGALAFGTIDSFLLYRLTGGRVHATDPTNAGRTLLFDIHAGRFDDALLALFRVPRAVLPEVRPSAGVFGQLQADLLGFSLPITGVAGDQQAALVGQHCFRSGEAKATFGTGCFLLVNTGPTATASQHRLLTTPAYQLGAQTSYALEGSVFMAGATVQWLRDGLKIIRHARDSEALAAAADPTRPVYLVPAFAGLGAPYWDADARGAILGLTREVGAPEIARAALEGVSFQVRDLIEAAQADRAQAGQSEPLSLRVDGGMVANQWFLQNLADILGRPVACAPQAETTALGAALLAGLGAGVFADPAALGEPEGYRVVEPRMAPAEREARYGGWREAVARVRTAP